MSKTEFYNKKARHDYEILESFEAGIVLLSPEIKAIRNGRVNMTGSYVKIIGEEPQWIGGNLAVLEGDAQRSRKLLLHKDQIAKLIGKSHQEGLSLIPLKLYLTRGKAKLEVGVGRGLKKYDKRQVLKQRDIERETKRKT